MGGRISNPKVPDEKYGQLGIAYNDALSFHQNFLQL